MLRRVLTSVTVLSCGVAVMRHRPETATIVSPRSLRSTRRENVASALSTSNRKCRSAATVRRMYHRSIIGKTLSNVPRRAVVTKSNALLPNSFTSEPRHSSPTRFVTQMPVRSRPAARRRTRYVFFASADRMAGVHTRAVDASRCWTLRVAAQPVSSRRHSIKARGFAA